MSKLDDVIGTAKKIVSPNKHITSHQSEIKRDVQNSSSIDNAVEHDKAVSFREDAILFKSSLREDHSIDDLNESQRTSDHTDKFYETISTDAESVFLLPVRKIYFLRINKYYCFKLYLIEIFHYCFCSCDDWHVDFTNLWCLFNLFVNFHIV